VRLDPASRILLALVVSLVVTFTAAAIGARASIDAATFYGALDKPSFAPPGWIFGPTWTLLYLSMAMAAFGVWKVRGWSGARGSLTLYLVQLVFNALWSVFFFGMRLGTWSLVDIGVLWVLLVATVVAFWRVRWGLGLLLVPYLLWVSFAAALNVAVVRMNPAAFG
jgi:tryptophan-rich sensory protein